MRQTTQTHWFTPPLLKVSEGVRGGGVNLRYCTDCTEQCYFFSFRMGGIMGGMAGVRRSIPPPFPKGLNFFDVSPAWRFAPKGGIMGGTDLRSEIMGGERVWGGMPIWVKILGKMELKRLY